MTVRFPSLPMEAFAGDQFNSEFLGVPSAYANANLKSGPEHWDYRNWNPVFGDISRYTLLCSIGAGQYSEVFRSLRDGNQTVAVKVLKYTNQDRVRREAKIMDILKDSPDILRLEDIVVDVNTSTTALITPLIETPIPKQLFRRFELRDIKAYAYRLLRALKLTHSNGIMHRDIKPDNILCSNPFDQFALADWNLAEFYHPLHKYTIYISTLPYKPPEILMEYGFYSYAVDVWAAGVTIAQMLLKRRPFKGESERDLLFSIGEVMGGPPLLELMANYGFKPDPEMRMVLDEKSGEGISCLIPTNYFDENIEGLLKKMLDINPRSRITAEEALMNPWFDDVISSLEQPSREAEV